MADIFTLTIRQPLGGRLFGETEEAERQRIAHLLADAAQIVGSPGRRPEPLRLEGVEVGEYEFGADSLNRG
jgi:hypothetical protein